MSIETESLLCFTVNSTQLQDVKSGKYEAGSIIEINNKLMHHIVIKIGRIPASYQIVDFSIICFGWTLINLCEKYTGVFFN